MTYNDIIKSIQSAEMLSVTHGTTDELIEVYNSGFMTEKEHDRETEGSLVHIKVKHKRKKAGRLWR